MWSTSRVVQNDWWQLHGNVQLHVVVQSQRTCHLYICKLQIANAVSSEWEYLGCDVFTARHWCVILASPQKYQVSRTANSPVAELLIATENNLALIFLQYEYILKIESGCVYLMSSPLPDAVSRCAVRARSSRPRLQECANSAKWSANQVGW